jgi:hypothetical protein
VEPVQIIGILTILEVGATTPLATVKHFAWIVIEIKHVEKEDREKNKTSMNLTNVIVRT